jgi:uncharacterized protein (DUF924 family)
MTPLASAQDVLRFWFHETDPSRWFTQDPVFDALIRERFADLHAAAHRCELFAWRATPEGRLAEVIVLDQFSRNLFRGQAEAFASDALALVLAQEAVHRGDDQRLAEASQKAFLYMPCMHSESALIHQEALKLFAQPGLEDNLRYEEMHWRIIERFGRYPHRNAVLGRASTPEEIAFLKEPNSSF